MKKLVCIFLLFVPSLCFASAANVWISQTAQTPYTGGGNCNGQDTSAVTFFNSSSSWGSGSAQIGPGTIVHLCGIITTELAFQGSGTSGNVVELLFESGASIQISPGMDSNGIINLGSYSYILIDGGANTPCGWNTATNTSEGSCNGQIENMLYGSSGATCPGGTCTTEYSSTGNNMINGSGSNVEIRNLQIGPSYIHVSTYSGGTDDPNGCGCVGATSGSNWNIHDNKLHDALWCINIQWDSGTMSNINVYSNEIYYASHDLAVDGGGSSSISLNDFALYGNYIHDSYNWDTQADDDHADGIHFFTSNGTGNVSGVAIYNNIFGGNTGADVTGAIFDEEFTTFNTVAIFNNLDIRTTSPNAGSSNHFWGPAECDSSCFVYNNTMARQTVTGGNLDLGYSTYAMEATIENNVNQGASNLVTVSASSPSLTLNYNAYGPNGGGIWAWEGTFYDTLASWQSVSGEGSSSFYNSTSLGLSGSYAPTTGSPLIGAGVNVCTANPTFCTNYPAIKSDLAGNARPSSGAWTIGAYNYVATTLPALSRKGMFARLLL